MVGALEQVQGMRLQQTLSPQMQHSLQLLQAPLMDLRGMVADELRQNPVLEEDPAGDRQPQEPAPPPARSSIGELWETYYPQSRDEAAAAAERHTMLIEGRPAPTSLASAIREQLIFLDLAPADRPLAAAIAGNLGPRGYLDATIEEIGAACGVPPLRVEQVLLRMQEHLEPPGLAARDLRECLLLQLRRAGRADTLAAKIVDRHLPGLAAKKFAALGQALDTTPEAVRAAAGEIAALEPNPGREFEQEPPVAVIPELIVAEVDGAFEVRLNRGEIPRLRISDTYKDLYSGGLAGGETARQYLREKLREGRFFLHAIEQRNDTILRIAREIVRRQEGFFRNGVTGLRPMTLAEVAAEVGLHETTVSRAVSGKFLECRAGVFELKYFFTAGLRTDAGGEVSNESVRNEVASLVKAESPARPLSDARIAAMLEGRGIRVARRTIAKYREQLGILPSNLRRS